MLHIVYNTRGFLDEWDYWAGTFGLVILALVETVIFVWIFGPDNAWRELHEGAAWQIPKFYKPIITYVTPLFLLIMMIWWTIQDAIPTLLMTGVPAENVPVKWASRGLMLLILVFELWLIKKAWAKKALKGGTA